jgi:hypothetical protein
VEYLVRGLHVERTAQAVVGRVLVEYGGAGYLDILPKTHFQERRVAVFECRRAVQVEAWHCGMPEHFHLRLHDVFHFENIFEKIFPNFLLLLLQSLMKSGVVLNFTFLCEFL